MTLLDDVLAYIKRRDQVSFANLSDEWPEHFRDGNKTLVLDRFENIMLWDGISDAGSEVVSHLRRSDIIEMKPCGLLVYLIDGRVPSLPLAKQKRQYRKPHWCPVVFCLTAKGKMQRQQEYRIGNQHA